MLIERTSYLEKLIAKQNNGLIKVITGLRRCGKSFLLFNIYYSYLIAKGVQESHIIRISLDDDENIKYRNPLNLGVYIREKMVDNDMYYIFIDEIQKCTAVDNPYLPQGSEKITFVDTLLGLMKKQNADVYVTGSNSKMLSSDILTEFRGRADEIRLQPLSYREFLQSCREDKNMAWAQYMMYGGMPYCSLLNGHTDKAKYLTGLCDNIYLNDILERNRLYAEKPVLDDLLDVVASEIGNLTSQTKIANTFASEKHIKINHSTISKYLDLFSDAFLINKVRQYNIRGRKYIDAPCKYYFSDVGIRNSRLNFRQPDEGFVMENLIYLELIHRGYSVDVGTIELVTKENGKSVRKRFEIDFVASKADKRIYIQSTLHMDTPEKKAQELKPFSYVKDAFKKIVVLKDSIVPFVDDNGVYNVGIEQFLLDEDI